MTLILNDTSHRYFKNSTNCYRIIFEYDRLDQIYVRDFSDNSQVNDFIIEGKELKFTDTYPDVFDIYRFTNLDTAFGTVQFSKFFDASSISSDEINNNLELFRQLINDWRASRSSSVDLSNSYGSLNFSVSQPTINVTASNLNSVFELFRRASLYISDLFQGNTPSGTNIDISRSFGTSKFSTFSRSNAITASDLNGNFELIRMALEEVFGANFYYQPGVPVCP